MRTWLKDRYHKGIGLGDLVKEYVNLMVHKDYTAASHKERRQRASEIVSTLNYLNSTKCTPVFSEEGEMLVEEVIMEKV